MKTSLNSLRTPRPQTVRLSLLALALGGTIAAFAPAGPINPPAGPVTSTYKTLTEVEPRTAINATNTPGDADSLFKITQPGSYYLTGNITGVAGRHGIEIAASGVTLDLMGFDLSGVPGMGAFDGVSATFGSSFTNITIRNGSVRGWGDEGIDLATMSNSAVTDVRASGNTGNGISTGVGSTVAGCTASNNAGGGIFANSGSTVTGCSASFNSVGIATGFFSTVKGCTASSNTGDGILANEGSTVTGCTASSNFGDGIQVSSDCRVTDNTCDSNGNGAGDGAGIFATSSDNRIEGNNCTDADRGIDVDVAGNFIIKNTCSGNTNNWDVVTGNVILVVNAIVAGAVTGNSGGVAPGSTDPNANFTY